MEPQISRMAFFLNFDTDIDSFSMTYRKTVTTARSFYI